MESNKPSNLEYLKLEYEQSRYKELELALMPHLLMLLGVLGLGVLGVSPIFANIFEPLVYTGVVISLAILILTASLTTLWHKKFEEAKRSTERAWHDYHRYLREQIDKIGKQLDGK